MTIAFTTRVGDYTVNRHVQSIIGIIVIFFTILVALKSKKQDFDYKYFFKLYLTPIIIIHAYSIVMSFIGIMDKKYLTSNITTYVPVILAICSVYLFKEKALKYNVISVVFSWLSSVGFSLITKGFYIFPYAILQGYTNIAVGMGAKLGFKYNYLELHELVLSLGYLIIYYLYKKNKLLKKDFIILFIVLLIFLLGVKRIAIIGVLVSYFCIRFFIKNKNTEKRKIKTMKWISMFIFVLSYLFVYLIFEGNEIYSFFSKLNIDLMGRNYYYSALINYGSFSLKFLGLGRNSISKILVEELAYLKVGGLHSDILKMYLENGFIIFGVWMWYYLFKIPKSYLKKFNFKVAALYICVIVYSFILYFTDNIEIYFMNNFFAVFVVLDYCYKQSSNKLATADN